MKNTKLFFIMMLITSIVITNTMEKTHKTHNMRIRTPEIVRKEREKIGSNVLEEVFKKLIDAKQVTLDGKTFVDFVNCFLIEQGMRCDSVTHKSEHEIKKWVIQWYSRRNGNGMARKPITSFSGPEILYQNGYKPLEDNHNDSQRDNVDLCDNTVLENDEFLFACD